MVQNIPRSGFFFGLLILQTARKVLGIPYNPSIEFIRAIQEFQLVQYVL